MDISPEIVWFSIGVALAVMEFVVPGVILIFFAIGAWIASITTYAGITSSLESQLMAFSLSSVVLLVSLRRWVRGKFIGHVTGIQNPDTNLDEFTGKKVVVLSDIEANKKGGRVEFKGADWSAESKETIKAGERAVIIGMDGLTLLVKKGE